MGRSVGSGGGANRLRARLKSHPTAAPALTPLTPKPCDPCSRSACYNAAERLMNLPHALTVTRIFLVPLLVVVLRTKFEGHALVGVPTPLVGAAIFGLASLTDWLDG